MANRREKSLQGDACGFKQAIFSVRQLLEKLWPVLAAFLVLTVIPATGFVLLGPGRRSLILSKSVLLADNLLALAYLLHAAYRARNTARAFWLLMASALGLWAIANFTWAYTACAAIDLPANSLWWSVYRLYGVPVAMTLFLKHRVVSPRHDPELMLDWTQIAILVCATYFVVLYLPLQQMMPRDALARNEIETNVANLLLPGAAFVVFRLRRSSALGTLYGRLVVLLAGYSIITAAGNYLDLYVGIGKAAWLDLLWSIPYFLAAGLACTWEPPEEDERKSGTRRERSFGMFLASNLALMSVLMVIVALAEHMRGAWRLLGICTIAVSLLVYAARLAVTQYSQQQEVRQRKDAEEKLQHSATHDQLTELPNRRMFLNRLQVVIERIRRHPQQMAAVLFIDFDDFKDINDSLGHSAGDAFIIEAGRRIRECMRSDGSVGRIGGDEFTALIEEVHDPSDAIRVAYRIQAALAHPFMLGGHELVKSASIGIALATAESSPDSVLQKADLAMYRAKSKGKGCSELFDASMQEQVMNRLNLEAQLRRALAGNKLEVYYQPIVAIASGMTQGFEALARWKRDGDLVPPDVFIPIAEQSGLIMALGKWVLTTACKQLACWQREYPKDPPLYVSVNVSAREFSHPNFISQVREALIQTGIRPESLKLELTESVAMKQTASTERTMSQLHELGVKLSIDDFGTGYSSLSYLLRFPVDTLKVDRSFVSRMDSNDRTSTVVRTVVALARSLGIQVVGEGVETTSQFEHLKLAECDSAQGFFFSKPLPADAIPAFVRSNACESCGVGVESR